jgi:single-stranded-DNA-specific exonuclease
VEYRLIGKNNYLDPINTILKNRGIEDIQSFLNIDEKVVIHWSKLKNIEKAAECLFSHIKNNNKIFVQVDADCDGVTSSAILINYLRRVFKDINIVYRLHEGKEHGVILETIPDDVDLVIIPDAGSNQYEEHKVLTEKGIDVIVLDHHEADKESEYAVVVNNQLSPEYENKTLTGAGIVYKFIQALDNSLGINIADDYLDLVALGLIADVADSRNLETRYYMNKGLNQIKNKFFQALVEKQSYSLKGELTIVGVQFYIAPLINACIRTGSMQEKVQMIEAFLESKEQVYNTRKKQHEDIQIATARMLVNIKNRQNRARDKGVKLIEERIKEKSLLDNKILIVNVTDILDKNLTGLVANQIISKYKRPVLLIRQKEDSDIFGGSARGYEKGVIKDLKQFLTDTNKFIFCEGHANAHGFEIEAEKIIELNNLINEQLKDVQIDVDIHDVDFIIPANQLKGQFIREVDKHKNLWGINVEEPVIAFKDIEVNKDEVYLAGKNKNTIKFTYKGIEFIKFRTSEEVWEELISKGERLVLDVVGKCSMNEYEGKVTPQIVMEDFAVTKTKKKQFVF